MDVDSEVDCSYSEDNPPKRIHRDVDYQDYIDIDDLDDEDEGQVCITQESIDKAAQELQDAALKYSLKLITDVESKDFVDRNIPVAPRHPGVSCLLWLPEERFPVYKKFWSPMEVWVDSWKLKSEAPFAYVNVHAYNSKKKGHGLYGVLLRDSQAKPVAASVVFSTEGESFFTQVLLGVLLGVTLAKQHGFTELRVKCNSLMVACIISTLWECRNVRCRNGDDGCICRNCFVYFLNSDGCNPRLVPIVRAIIAQSPESQSPEEMVGCPMGLNNKAARYLAKMGKEMAKSYTGRIVRKFDIQPDRLPLELKEILWEDAHGKIYNHHLWRRVKQEWPVCQECGASGYELRLYCDRAYDCNVLNSVFICAMCSSKLPDSHDLMTSTVRTGDAQKLQFERDIQDTGITAEDLLYLKRRF